MDRLNRRWLGFRDAFGAFWALRVLQMINQTAELQQWPVRLVWGGFAQAASTEKDLDDDAKPDLPSVSEQDHVSQIDQALDTVLRRFC